MKYIFVAILLTVVNITAVFAADPPAAQGQGQVDRGVCKTDNSARVAAAKAKAEAEAKAKAEAEAAKK